jgi:hypothetical protein
VCGGGACINGFGDGEVIAIIAKLIFVLTESATMGYKWIDSSGIVVMHIGQVMWNVYCGLGIQEIRSGGKGGRSEWKEAVKGVGGGWWPVCELWNMQEESERREEKRREKAGEWGETLGSSTGKEL